jgi:hypothetical protein
MHLPITANLTDDQSKFMIFVARDSQIPQETLAAYMATHFIVSTKPPITLLIGDYSSLLASMLGASSAGAAFITAYNPRGVLLSDAENTERHRMLIAHLTEQGYEFLEGEGVDPNGEWPGETSVLVLDIDRASAERLGASYDQNAIVWIDTDAIPRLLVLR